MKSKNQKLDHLPREDCLPKSNSQFQNNKESQPYRSYFYRSTKQLIESSPSQSSQTNKLSKTKDRLKSTRVKSKEGQSIYYELESTKKNENQKLKQENIELKKIISDLKISQLYQVDEKKIRNLLEEAQQLRNEIKVLRKQNEKLKLENDFLSRSNFQLKVQLNAANKRTQQQNMMENSSSLGKEFKPYFEKSKIYCNQDSINFPEHLFIRSKNMRSSINQGDEKQEQEVSIKKQKQKLRQQRTLAASQSEYSLSRYSNQKRINFQSVTSRRKTKIKQVGETDHNPEFQCK